MCDELTDADNAAWLATHALDRRSFNAKGLGLAAALPLVGACTTAPDSADPNTGDAAVTRAAVDIPTADGTADAYFVYPSSGRYPAVILWPDIVGLRGSFKAMADRLAAAGYAVLAVNQYYRSQRAPVIAGFAKWQSDAGQARLKPMIAAITSEATARDAAAFVSWLDRQAAVDTARKIGTQGYCMGGPHAMRAAAARADRIGAFASFHGAALVTDKPESPHLLFSRMRAAGLLAIAQNDDARMPDAKDVLRKAASAAGRTIEIEVYPAQHGWCVADSPVYDAPQAERAWGRLLALYQNNL